MGSRIARKLVEDGHEVFVWNRSKEKVLELQKSCPEVKTADSLEELVKQCLHPRVLWLMLPAGEATQSILDEVASYVQEKDIIVDGGNAHYKDTERRFEEMKKRNIQFLGIGVSGGLTAYNDGYPLMVGGDKSAYEHIEPILSSLSKPCGGHEYFGEGGAGHFVKMVHNGIEYGYMQALGEGFGVLEKSKYNFDLLSIARLYQKNTLLSGYMMDRSLDALVQDPKLEYLEGIIDVSGEAAWTVEAAKEENVPVEIIEKSLEFRKKSQTDIEIKKSFAARMVAALRNVFGGHEVKKK